MQCSCITLVNELLIWNQFWWKKYFQKYFYVKKLSTESLKILYFKYETFLSEKSLITLYNAPFCWNLNSKLVIPGSHKILTLPVPLLSPPLQRSPWAGVLLSVVDCFLLPLTVQSRAESRTSMASVTTIDEINMGFELAILAGQEAMLEESSEEGKTSPWQARDQCKTRTCLVTGDGAV